MTDDIITATDHLIITTDYLTTTTDHLIITTEYLITTTDSVRVSLATIIAISSRLKESSDGFDFAFSTVQMILRSQTSTRYITYFVTRGTRPLTTLGIRIFTVVSLATIIAISSRLKESSDGFNAVLVRMIQKIINKVRKSDHDQAVHK
jgi:hypothetical protein